MSVDPLPLVAECLSRQSGRLWEVVGNEVHGPGTTAVVTADHHDDGMDTRNTAHVDLGFVLNRNDRTVPVIWDCATGWGASEEQAMSRAVDAWSQTSAATVVELLQQDGSHADHYGSDDPNGFRGWHSIHGAILGWGSGDGPDLLQRWWLDHPVLPVIRNSVGGMLSRDSLNGVRVFLGSQRFESTVEVRLNGELVPEAAEALSALDWPRFDQPAYARSFVLLVHAESATDT